MDTPLTSPTSENAVGHIIDSETEPPCSAGAKLRPMNDSSQWSTLLTSNSERKALHVSSKTWVSYLSFCRRQQVDWCGHILGTSFHRAPVLSIWSIPSKTKESSALARPPFGRRGLGNERSDPPRSCTRFWALYSIASRLSFAPAIVSALFPLRTFFILILKTKPVVIEHF